MLIIILIIMETAIIKVKLTFSINILDNNSKRILKYNNVLFLDNLELIVSNIRCWLIIIMKKRKLLSLTKITNLFERFVVLILSCNIPSI